MSDHSSENSAADQAGSRRRDFLRASAFFGAGALAAGVATPATALVQQPEAGPQANAAKPSATLPPVQPHGPAGVSTSVAEVYERARQALYPICRVCPQCDGVACAGEYPGLGGIFSGASFQNNYRALQRAGLKLMTIHGVSNRDKKPDTSTVIFGQKISLPALAAPIGGTGQNFRNRLPDAQYFDAIIGGAVAAGTMGAIGDGAADPMTLIQGRYDVIARYGGRAIAGIKPRPQENFLRIVRMAEAANAFMITIDTDSAGRYQGNTRETMMEPKTVAQLRELVRSTKIPLVVKGIMTPEEAVLVLETGAAGIAVSNHGGRVLDGGPGTAEVLPAIADKVKGKTTIFVDGCVHYGTDIIKYMALGADAVLVGRHLARAAFGGGKEGVALFLKTMRDEMEAGMVLTGSPDVRSINRKILA